MARGNANTKFSDWSDKDDGDSHWDGDKNVLMLLGAQAWGIFRVLQWSDLRWAVKVQIGEQWRRTILHSNFQLLLGHNEWELRTWLEFACPNWRIRSVLLLLLRPAFGPEVGGLKIILLVLMFLYMCCINLGLGDGVMPIGHWNRVMFVGCVMTWSLIMNLLLI